MAIPSFNGATIFGIGWEVAVPVNAPRIQYTSYNGVNGRESIFLGSNGLAPEVVFLQTAADEATLGAYENLFRNLIANGVVGVFIDSLGQIWPNARMMSFAPVECPEPALAPAFNAPPWVSRTYRVTFEVA